MFKEIFQEKYKIPKDDGPLIRANEFIVSVNGKEKFHYKGGKTSYWKRSEKYASSTSTGPEWEKFAKNSSTDANAKMIVQWLMDDGFDVSDVDIKS